jgi:hypothetical protein
MGWLIRCVHRATELRLALWELEGVSWQTRLALHRRGVPMQLLLRLQESKVDVLLVGRGNLLLLLLKEFDLLLQC